MCQLDVLTGVDVLLSADALVKKAFPGVPEGLAINKRQRISVLVFFVWRATKKGAKNQKPVPQRLCVCGRNHQVPGPGLNTTEPPEPTYNLRRRELKTIYEGRMWRIGRI
jgi:hypothetical protein